MLRNFVNRTSEIINCIWGLLAPHGGEKEALLIRHSANGDMEEVKALLKQGAYLNARDSDGDTALFVAAHFGHTDIVKLPAEKGAKDNPEKPAMEIVQKKIKEKK